MEKIQDYRHIETREGLFDSQELPTYPSYVARTKELY